MTTADEPLGAGVRVQVTGGPWPERIGATGRIVDGPDRYPWHGRGPREAVVLLDSDPLGISHPEPPHWTCVLHLDHLAPAGDADPPSYERLQGLVHLAEEVIGSVRAMVEDGHPVDPDWFRIVSQAVQRWEEA